MIDNRILTFLKLCEVGNYRITAEELNMTQPAVTQHIHFLEEQYSTKLFIYKDRKLFKTPQCEELEKHALAILYNEQAFRKQVAKPRAKKIAVGATKTVGEYYLAKKLPGLLSRDDINFELVVDNTTRLLGQLHALKLDLLMIEGYFDKNEYGYQLIKKEEIVGICDKSHPFAGKEVELSDVFAQHVILREEGSGTRNVFENFLQANNQSVHQFEKISVISSILLIEKVVSLGAGISFVYSSVAKSNRKIATFKIKNEKIQHEFNYVYLKNANLENIVAMLNL